MDIFKEGGKRGEGECSRGTESQGTDCAESASRPQQCTQNTEKRGLSLLPHLKSCH